MWSYQWIVALVSCQIKVLLYRVYSDLLVGHFEIGSPVKYSWVTMNHGVDLWPTHSWQFKNWKLTYTINQGSRSDRLRCFWKRDAAHQRAPLCRNRKLYDVWFVLGTAPSRVSIPPNQSGTIAKGRWMRRENVLGKIQASERYSEVVFLFRRATRLRDLNSPLAA